MPGPVVLRAVPDLVPYARNARTHSDEQVAQIAASIREFGFTNPVLLDGSNGILAGHCRVLAARKLALDEVPCIDLAHLTETQRRAYVLADNRLAENAGWDREMLGLELGELAGLGFDMAPLGFGSDDMPPEQPTGDPDEVPDTPDDSDVYVQRGDLYTLGSHRLLCGDSTVPADVERVMAGARAALCLTDPPYGIGEDYASHDDTQQNLATLVAGFLPLARASSEVVLLTPGNSNQRHYPAPEWTLAWFVPAGTGRSCWGFSCWQPVLAYGKDPYLAAGKGARPDALVKTESADNSLGHPCPKPVGVWSWLLERGSSRRGDVVFEPFGGSGTTIVACEQLGRSCRAIELEPKYVQVAIERWERLTGQQATLDGDGRTFDDVRMERIDGSEPRA